MSESGQNSQYCGQVSSLDDKSHQLCSPYYSPSFPWVERDMKQGSLLFVQALIVKGIRK